MSGYRNDPELAIRAAIEYARTGVIPSRETVENADLEWQSDVMTAFHDLEWALAKKLTEVVGRGG